MNRQKLFLSLILAFAVAIFQTSMAAAQDATPPLTGYVQNITIETTDTTPPVTTVVVTYKDDAGAIQTVRLSVETAASPSLGLIKVDSTKTPPEIDTNYLINQPITIDPTMVITDPADETTEAEHPVGSKLTDFFGDLLGVDYGAIMAAHENGAGFGVIAQALWMTNNLNGDANTFQAIIEAKKTGDYSNLTLPDGSTSTATNWGQFKKDATDKDDKDNLGSIMSGKADNSQTQDDTTTLNESANGNSGNQGNNGKGNDHDKGKDKGKDKGDKGKGKP
ncbi:MAG: hypothetical protein MUO77_12240 [Anaerolineales bacterium]|nr:hypothetical protein [Anaerolineales bacterium]